MVTAIAPSFATVDEVAARWGVTPAAVYKWIRQGRLKHFRHGKTYAIPPGVRRPKPRKAGRKKATAA